MKRLVTILVLFISLVGYSQETFNLDVKIPKTKEQVIGKSERTSHSALWKGITYEVYRTKNGSLFIVVENKEKTGYTKKTIKKEYYEGKL